MDNTAEDFAVNQNGLPNWLTAGNPPALKPSKEGKELAFVQFNIVLPRILELVCSGATLSVAIRELPVKIDQGAFMRWLKRDTTNYQLYREAKEVRAEVWSGKAIQHAEGVDEDGNTTLEDVSRSRLIVDTYKWLMGADSRKVYGDTKSIEVNSTGNSSTIPRA